MSERAILMSGSMVRAILEGRKTQTRRVITRIRGYRSLTEFGDSDTPGYTWHFRRPDGCWCDLRHKELLQRLPYCVDDLLYVRETVASGVCAPSRPGYWTPGFWRRMQGTAANPNGLWYRADGLAPEKPISPRGRWVPGIHMPKWAARIWLEVTDVRVQQLQDISEEDAIAEGLLAVEQEGWGISYTTNMDGFPVPDEDCHHYPSEAFLQLWDSLNAKRGYGWDKNPWVAAYTFKRIEKPA